MSQVIIVTFMIFRIINSFSFIVLSEAPSDADLVANSIFYIYLWCLVMSRMEMAKVVWEFVRVCPVLVYFVVRVQIIVSVYLES